MKGVSAPGQEVFSLYFTVFKYSIYFFLMLLISL